MKRPIRCVTGEIVIIARVMIAGAAAMVAQRSHDGQMMRLPGKMR